MTDAGRTLATAHSIELGKQARWRGVILGARLYRLPIRHFGPEWSTRCRDCGRAGGRSLDTTSGSGRQDARPPARGARGCSSQGSSAVAARAPDPWARAAGAARITTSASTLRSARTSSRRGRAGCERERPTAGLIDHPGRRLGEANGGRPRATRRPPRSIQPRRSPVRVRLDPLQGLPLDQGNGTRVAVPGEAPDDVNARGRSARNPGRRHRRAWPRRTPHQNAASRARA